MDWSLRWQYRCVNPCSRFPIRETWMRAWKRSFNSCWESTCRRNLLPVDKDAQEPESVTAVVGFGGLLSGACVFTSRPDRSHRDRRPYDRHGVSGDRRHRKRRHWRDLQHACRRLERQGSGAGRQLRTLGSRRDHRPRLQASRAGARISAGTIYTASKPPALPSPSSATACSSSPPTP